jgi:hypothetical protein
VSVGGTGVGLGGAGVSVGGTGVGLGGTGVSVGGTSVGLGGTAVSVGCNSVADGRTVTSVGWDVVAGPAQAVSPVITIPRTACQATNLAFFTFIQALPLIQAEDINHRHFEREAGVKNPPPSSKDSVCQATAQGHPSDQCA